MSATTAASPGAPVAAGAPGSAPRLYVGSEAGVLRRVILHRPDLELRRLTPSNKDELLFDDVLWVKRARQEHDAFADILAERDVEVKVAKLDGFVLSPPPNRLFTRDTSAWAYDGVSVHAMTKSARRREAIRLAIYFHHARSAPRVGALA